MTLSAADAGLFEDCIERGGVAVFGADTVYGLACDPHDEAAVARLYEMKERPRDKPAAVMFFCLDAALAALPALEPRTREALTRLLPGALTILLPNSQRCFARACGPDPQTLGLRVPALPAASNALTAVRRPVLQSSANRSGAAEARRLDEVDGALLSAADLVLDGGVLPGTASTVLDLRTFEAEGEWAIVREGAVSPAALTRVLGSA
jgi:L-threonylcarbamoyladenylate synthase